MRGGGGAGGRRDRWVRVKKRGGEGEGENKVEGEGQYFGEKSENRVNGAFSKTTIC